MLHQVPNTGYGELLVNAGDPPSLIVNRDLLAALILTNDPATASRGGTGDVRIVDPLGSVVVSGKETLYGLGTQGGSGTIQVDVHQETVQWDSPTLLAAQLAITGIPITDNPTILAVNFNQTIAAGGSFTTPHLTVRQFQSIIGTLFSTATSAGQGATPFVKVTLAWSIASDNYDPLRQDDWVIPSTPFNFTYNYRNDVRAPCDGDTCTITFTNYDTKATNVTYGIFGSYRPRTRPELRGRYQWIPATGLPNDAAGLGSDSILLAFTGGAIGGGASGPEQLMNLQNAPATVTGIVNGGGPAGSWFLVVSPVINGALSQAFEIPSTAQGLLAPTEIMLPRHVCFVNLANNGAGNVAITGYQLLITTQEQPT